MVLLAVSTLSILLTLTSASDLQAALAPLYPQPYATIAPLKSRVSDASNSVITPGPDVLRRQNAITTCNSGLCGQTQYCTVFRENPNYGVCCNAGFTCTPQTDCVPYNTASDPGSRTQPAIFNGIVTCDRIRPYCIKIDVKYGYGTENLLVTNCFSENIGTTSTTNLWYLENVINRQTSTEEPTDDPTTEDPTSPTEETTAPNPTRSDPPPPPSDDKSLSTGAIAGIAVGGVALVCIAACIIAFMIFRRRKHARTTDNGGDGNIQTYYPPPVAPVEQNYYAPPKPEQQYYGNQPAQGMSPPYSPGYQTADPSAKPYGSGTPSTLAGGTQAGSADNRTSMMSELPGSSPHMGGYRP